MEGFMENHGHLDGQSSVETHMYTNCDSNAHIFDLYSVGTGTALVAGKGQGDNAAQPFVDHIAFHGPQGELVRVKALIDDGAMVNALDISGDFWLE
ncbi:hypothetical protein PHLCEN_2v6800 [Hermanssonia centrifuga]|uniref:Uncharacterized protein n=1 Tax=Hermanssonia centrifuga TaxID=98765 RepID=A0A2R6NYD8_9APHY|nr:hypothetical protein PHLCEN_2v6800 [Hermanssonia centrifuga]